MEKRKRNFKGEITIFLIVMCVYLLIAYIIFSQTTIFYDTNNVYDVLLDTDTGVLFTRNIFAIKADNSKHILFTPIVSLLAYPIYLISETVSKSGVNFNTVYGLGLTILQILVSCTSITLTYNLMKNIKIRKTILILLTVIMTVSFPQLFMTLSVERFIYAQLSLVFFIFIVSKMKNKESYIIDVIAIPLIGITTTNIYLYIINILLSFKLNIKKIAKHLGMFILTLYLSIIATKSYLSIFLMTKAIETDSSRFIPKLSLIEKIKAIITRLIYPTLYFPGYKIAKNKMFQSGSVNKVFLLLIIIVLILVMVAAIKNYKEKIVQLCLGTILVNIILHGAIGYNLLNANIMAIHFSFALIVLLAYFAKDLNEKNIIIFSVFLIIVLITMIISDIKGFSQILTLGIEAYSK